MSVVKQAKQVISAELNKYKALKECADFVDSLESLEQFEKETNQRIVKAKRDAELCEGQLAEAQKLVEQNKSAAVDIKAKAESAAAKIKSDAVTEAEKILQKAQDEADEILKIREEIEKAKSDLANLKYEVAEENKKLGSLKAERKRLLEQYA